MVTTWFTADLHFGHKQVLGYSKRPWVDIDEHDEAILTNLNESVGPHDTLWVLGDVCFRNAEETERIFRRLPGREKHLVRGNHDARRVTRLPWDSVSELRYLRVAGLRFVLCHYPMLTWQRAHEGVPMLHGHSHGNLSAWLQATTRFDVGVDCWQYHPVDVDTLAHLAGTRTYRPVDHHRRKERSPGET